MGVTTHEVIHGCIVLLPLGAIALHSMDVLVMCVASDDEVVDAEVMPHKVMPCSGHLLTTSCVSLLTAYVMSHTM